MSVLFPLAFLEATNLSLSNRSLSRSSRSTTTPELPLKAALCSAVLPSTAVVRVTALIAFSADHDADAPLLVVLLLLSPRSSSAATRSKPQTAAHVRAVCPVMASTPGSAPWIFV